MPCYNYDTAGNHSCDGAFCRHIFPVKCKKDERSEGCAKACPCVGNQSENGRVRVQGKQKSNEGDKEYYKASDIQYVFFSSVLFDKSLVDIAAYGRGCGKKLTVCGRH